MRRKVVVTAKPQAAGIDELLSTARATRTWICSRRCS